MMLATLLLSQTLFILYCIVNSKAFRVETYPIYDWNLCNNGRNEQNDPFRGYQCSLNNDGDTTIEKCDSRVIPDEKCLGASIHLSNYQTEKNDLSNVFSIFDSNDFLRRMSFYFPIQEESLWKMQFDSYLESRPWLAIRHESFSYLHNDNSIVVIVEKYRYDYEAYLRMIAAIEYRPKQECDSSTMLMVTRNTFIHPGWAGVCATLFLEHDLYSFATTVMYISGDNDPLFGTGFIDATDCPGVVNRWECAFLKTSNCSVPSDLTSCQSRNCVQNIPSTDNFGVYYYKNNRISPNEGNVSIIAKAFRQPVTYLQRIYHAKTVGMPLFARVSPSELPWLATYLRNDTHKVFNTLSAAPREVLFIHQYLLRMNYQYREAVVQKLDAFDKKYVRQQQRSIEQRAAAANADVQKSQLYPDSRNRVHSGSHSLNHHKQESRRLDESAYVEKENISNDDTATNTTTTTTMNSSPDDTSSIGVKVESSRRVLASSSSVNNDGIRHAHYHTDHSMLFPRCIAAHVRRTDRLGPRISNITKYCIRHEKDEIGGDFGCETFPFANIHLKEVLEVARVMSFTLHYGQQALASAAKRIRTLIVATDDEDWLRNEIKLLKKKPKYRSWQILFLPSNLTSLHPSPIQNPSPSSSSSSFSSSSSSASASKNTEASVADNMRARQGTSAGIQLMATMKLLQRCEGFIGHFDSGAAWMFYQSMCLRHHRPAIHDTTRTKAASADTANKVKTNNDGNDDNDANMSQQDEIGSVDDAAATSANDRNTHLDTNDVNRDSVLILKPRPSRPTLQQQLAKRNNNNLRSKASASPTVRDKVSKPQPPAVTTQNSNINSADVTEENSNTEKDINDNDNSGIILDEYEDEEDFIYKLGVSKESICPPLYDIRNGFQWLQYIDDAIITHYEKTTL